MPFHSLHLVGLLNYAEQYKIHLRSQEHREQRKLKRAAGIVKTEGAFDVSKHDFLIRPDHNAYSFSKAV